MAFHWRADDGPASNAGLVAFYLANDLQKVVQHGASMTSDVPDLDADFCLSQTRAGTQRPARKKNPQSFKIGLLFIHCLFEFFENIFLRSKHATRR